MKICRVDEGAVLEQMVEVMKKDPYSLYYVSGDVLKALRKRATSFRGKFDNTCISIIAKTYTNEWCDILLHKLNNSENDSCMYCVVAFEQLVDTKYEQLLQLNMHTFDRVFFVI